MGGIGLIGKKLGMTQIFSQEGDVVPVTVLAAGPCHVTALRSVERHGYDAVQLAFGEAKEQALNRPLLGHLKKADAPPSGKLVEFRGKAEIAAEDDGGGESGELKLGDQVTVAIFKKGQRVKVRGRSKGKGFQGTIKRHNFHRGPVSHGSHNVRAPGSVGASATPSRVFKGQRLPGHMGDVRVTQPGVEVVDIDTDQNLLLLRGAVPGATGALVEVVGE